jgi:hypothetical protein
MKLQNLSVAVLAAVAFGLAGCNKSEPTIGEKISTGADSTADSLKKAGEAVKDTGEKVVKDVKDEAGKVADAASAKSQEMIDKAKAYVFEKKYQDALNTLKGLATLSPEQQKVVDDLKAEIQKALASNPGTLLNK